MRRRRWVASGVLGAAIGIIESHLQFRNAYKNWPRWRVAAKAESFFHKQIEDIITAERDGWAAIMKSQPNAGITASSVSQLPPVK
jgi:hypothetical protein